MIKYFIILLLIIILLNCKKSEGFNITEPHDSTFIKLRDSHNRKVYIMSINGSKYVWKYTKEISTNELHKFCKTYPHINHKGAIDIVGIMNINGFDGVVMPYIKNGNINGYNKTVILKLIDVVAFLDTRGFYAVPDLSNILVDDNGYPYIINYFSDTILKHRSQKVMKKNLLNTIISLKFKINENDVMNNIDNIRLPDRIVNFMNDKCALEYHHITNWIQDI